MDPTNTAALLAACRSGQREAWDELLDRYEQLVFVAACREGLSEDDAADVAQITFEALLLRIDSVGEGRELGSWLLAMARRQSRRVRAGVSIPPPPVCDGSFSEPLPEDPTVHYDTAMWVRDGMEQLDPPCRDLIAALYFDPSHPSYAELASRLGRPLGSIGPTRARCLERLRRLLDDADRRW